MARYDKYDPIAGGSRAKLNANLTLDGNGEFGPKAVSLNTTGRVVVGTAGGSGLFGILVKNAAKQPSTRWQTNPFAGAAVPAASPGTLAGDVVDVMHSGDIVGLDTAVFLAGRKVYATAAGDLTLTSTGNFPIGWTVEAGRLVVRISPGTVASA